jgi:translation initiation factor 2 subunit 3
VAKVKTKNENPEAKKSGKKFDERLVPSANIGMVGHVGHGKTMLTEALTGKLTLTHSEELKRGITIRLGYADAKIYKCKKCDKFSSSEKCPYCFGDAELQRTISLIDAPGHETLMATVLTGTSLMDGAILIIAANERCPQPQTREHVTALNVVGIKNVIIVQSKIDLVDEKEAMKNYKEIKDFVKGTVLENAPIIPVSSQKRINIDLVLETIQKMIPAAESSVQADKEPRMLIARSFDINKPGTIPKKISGGVLGGSIVHGKLKVGDEIEIRPGIRKGEHYRALKTKIIGLQKAGINLEEAGPGGLLGVMTELDPALTKSDSLVGNIIGLPGKLPETKYDIELEVKLMERVVGSETMGTVQPLKLGENLMVNVGTARSVGSVTSIKKTVSLRLKIPLCIEKKERIVISRQISGRWRLIGYGITH